VITEKDLVFEECIGKGSFAVVYQGKWAEKEVALKKMRLPSGISPESLPNIQEINILRYCCVGAVLKKLFSNVSVPYFTMQAT